MVPSRPAFTEARFAYGEGLCERRETRKETYAREILMLAET